MNDQDDFLYKLKKYYHDKIIEKKLYLILKSFYFSYSEEINDKQKNIALFLTLLDKVIDQINNPFVFEAYHKKIQTPFDYYKFGIDFLNPLVSSGSKILGLENIEKIKEQLKNNENVILFSNHQTESDPQAISILLQNSYPEIASKIIYIAGERVITDPFAVPFSMGCDLLCIYSKKYIDTPIELKMKKQNHNIKTMQYMSSLLKEGNKIIYVAPSGGRDRQNEEKEIEIAPFDSKNIEMFYLMAKKSKTKTHFYPLSLMTYNLLPPPDTTQIELGEERKTKKGNIFAFFGEELDMENYPGSTEIDKLSKRENRTHYIYNFVKQGYNHLRSL